MRRLGPSLALGAILTLLAIACGRSDLDQPFDAGAGGPAGGASGSGSGVGGGTGGSAGRGGRARAAAGVSGDASAAA